VSVTAWRLLAVAAAVSLLHALAPSDARAADASVAQCEPAYEGVQLLRQRGKLIEARTQADVCARDVCPEIARRDCGRWTDELAREIPSVVVIAREEPDREVPGVRVLVDGVARAEAASGRAFDLDPGAHVFRVERPSGAPVEQSFTVYQGERDRLLRITLPRVAPAVVVPPPEPPPPQLIVPDQPSPPHRGSLVPAFVVGGFSIAAFATSGYLGLTGRQELSNLRGAGGCAPTCSDAQVDPVRTRLTASDVVLGVGLFAAAVAVTLFVVSGRF
jgi:hypothetical protein